MTPMEEAIKSGDFERMKDAVRTQEFAPVKKIRTFEDMAEQWDPYSVPGSWADIVVGAALRREITNEQYAELAEIYRERMAGRMKA